MNIFITSAEMIFANMDANKRIQLSMRYPSIRKVESTVPLKVDFLEITPSSVTVNTTTYSFGEVLEVFKGKDPDNEVSYFTWFMRSSRIFATPESCLLNEQEINGLNNRLGGMPWRSLKNEVVAPGDVVFPNSDDGFLDSQRFQIIRDLRELFMKTLENFLNRKEGINPMGLFQARKYENPKWFEELFKLFITIDGSSFAHIQKFHSAKCFESFFESRRFVTTKREDDLSKNYPKAFKLMIETINLLNNQVFPDSRGLVLEKLTYPQKQFSSFGQFTVTELKTNIKIVQRLPPNITIRNAYKKFTGAVFQRKTSIGVGKLTIDGSGIFGLPLYFKLYPEKLEFNGEESMSLLGCYEQLMAGARSVILDGIYNAKLFELEFVRKCSDLFLNYRSFDPKIFRHLENNHISIKYPLESLTGILDTIEYWSWNSRRKVGSKVLLEYLRDVSAITTSCRLLKLGFVEENNEGTKCLVLPQDGKKVLKLMVEDAIGIRNGNTHFQLLHLVIDSQ